MCTSAWYLVCRCKMVYSKQQLMKNMRLKCTRIANKQTTQQLKQDTTVLFYTTCVEKKTDWITIIGRIKWTTTRLHWLESEPKHNGIQDFWFNWPGVFIIAQLHTSDVKTVMWKSYSQQRMETNEMNVIFDFDQSMFRFHLWSWSIWVNGFHVTLSLAYWLIDRTIISMVMKCIGI